MLIICLLLLLLGGFLPVLLGLLSRIETRHSGEQQYDVR